MFNTFTGREPLNVVRVFCDIRKRLVDPRLVAKTRGSGYEVGGRFL